MTYKVISLIVEDHDNFIHILADTNSKQAMVIDPAWDGVGIKEELEAEGLDLVGILITHSHYDHINAVNELYQEGVSLFVGEDELPLWVDCPKDAVLLADGDQIQFGSSMISVIKTAGHTQGSLCYLLGNNLFTGDTLFIYGCGRTDLPSGDPNELFRSFNKLKALPNPEKITVWAGHDYGVVQETSLAEQIKHNPFLLAESEEEFFKVRTKLAPYLPFPCQPIEKEDLKLLLSKI